MDFVNAREDIKDASARSQKLENPTVHLEHTAMKKNLAIVMGVGYVNFKI